MQFEFIHDLEKVRRVSENRQYWFIRTYSGAVYDEFWEEDYIGIGLNNVPQNLIKYATDYEEKKSPEFDILRHYIANNTDHEGGEVTKWANQLVKFQHEIKKGDIVIIPSRDSKKYAIGEVESDVYLVEEKRKFAFKEGFEYFPEKRRNVKWHFERNREEFRGDLAKYINTRSALTNINKAATVIESQFSSLFMIGKVGYLSININQDEDINAFAFARFLNSITFFYKDFCQQMGVEENEELYIKIKVQSKGKAIFKVLAVGAIIGVTLVLNLKDNQIVQDEINGTIRYEGEKTALNDSLMDYINDSLEKRTFFMELHQSKDQLKVNTEDQND